MAYKINPDTCVACGTCQGECPSGAIKEGDVYSIDPNILKKGPITVKDVYSIDPNICIDCGTCADACPMGAIAPAE